MKRVSFSAAFLKNIAYLSMFIDHFFAVVFMAYIQWLAPQGLVDTEDKIYQIGRAVGRVAFILFAFMASEGFYYTHNRRNYLLRLGCFALLSEVPFDLAIEGKLFYAGNQNVYFTLFFGVFALWLIETLRGHLLIQTAGTALCCVAAMMLKTDYMFMGVLLIVVFYVCRKSFWLQAVFGSIVIYFGIVLIYFVRYAHIHLPVQMYFTAGLSELYGLFAFFFIYFYNGKKGKQLPKACYYLFYPLHLLLLYGIEQWLFPG